MKNNVCDLIQCLVNYGVKEGLIDTLDSVFCRNRLMQMLGVDDFVKRSSFLYYTQEALAPVAERIADFAEREGLHAHAQSVTIRSC